MGTQRATTRAVRVILFFLSALLLSSPVAEATTSEIASVVLSAVLITDDGTADFVCTRGVPDPNRPPGFPQDCPVRDAGAAGDASCDTPGLPGSGDCGIVPDGVVDPGELASVRVTLINQTFDASGQPRPLTNVEVGLVETTPGVACFRRDRVFVGNISGNGTVTTAPNALQFLLSPATGQASNAGGTLVELLVTVAADGIQGNSPPQTFQARGDTDEKMADVLPASCGGPAGALGPAHAEPGVLCEDFDTERNGIAGIQWTRLFLAVSPADPLLAEIDPNDDVLGHSADGGAAPLGVHGKRCSEDDGAAFDVPGCWPLSIENDWHLHSAFEGCDPMYDPLGILTSSCAPEARAHSGFRSLHLGRHLSGTDTNYDTYRFRQTSAFVMDPVNLGKSSTLEFWHIMQVCDDKCVNAGNGGTTAGGQAQISTRNRATGLYERWQRLTPTKNGYNSAVQNTIVICQFDPGDDQNPPLDETMCQGAPLWSDIGDLYGSDRTCTVDQDHNDPVDKDCGSTTNRTVVAGCSWVADPSCGSYLENGSVGRGVWARSKFDLSPFKGRTARLRWIFEGGGGWSFGQSRSWLEPQSGGLPHNVFDQDDGWYIDDIRLTDLRVAPLFDVPDPTDGALACPTQGDDANCGRITIAVAGSTIDARSGLRDVGSAQPGGPVLLDARASIAEDDPGTPIPEGSCAGGTLEFRWSSLDRATGAPTAVVQDYSPDATLDVSPLADALYQVDVRCSSDTSCAASAPIDVLVYPGDGSDVMTRLDANGTVLEGLAIDNDPVTHVATLSWRGRPQPSGVSGWDLFRAIVSTQGVDIFAANRFTGTCFANAVPNGANGSLRTRTDTNTHQMPANSARLYMLAHSSNNTAALLPLGFRPASSSRAGTLVTSSVTCP